VTSATAALARAAGDGVAPALIEATLAMRRVAMDFSPAVFASSLAAEDMVLTDLILRNKLPIGIFSLDTGRLHKPRRWACWTRIEGRYGYDGAGVPPADRSGRRLRRRRTALNAFYDSVEMRKECCRIRKVEPLGRALAGKRAWITGQRRAQAATRADARVQEDDPAHGMAKFNPLADWSKPTSGPISAPTTCPTTRCTTAATRRSAASPAPARSSPARTCAPAAGGGKTPNRRNAACTSSTASSSASNPAIQG
jgi:hypothetical protein